MNNERFEIKAVTFDLWETLLLERDGANSQRTLIRCSNLVRVLERFGVQISMSQLASAFEAMTPWLLSFWKSDKEVAHQQQIRFLVEKASNGSVQLKEQWLDELSQAYVSPIFELPPYLNPDAPGLLQWIKSRHKKIGLICNVGHTPGSALRGFLRRESLEKNFDAMIFSDEVGIRKPNPHIFHLTAKALGVEPSRAVHIGDNLKSDVWGAKNAGFKAIYLSSEVGRDRIAESDPASLVSISRKLGKISEEKIAPDKTIGSLAMVTKAIQELER